MSLAEEVVKNKKLLQINFGFWTAGRRPGLGSSRFLARARSKMSDTKHMEMWVSLLSGE